jgi:hypothetical protein
MGKFIDLTGQRFGRLVVVELDKQMIRTFWKCLCDCGEYKTVRNDSLTGGKVRSCGCLHKEVAKKQGESNRKNIEIGRTFGKLKIVEIDRIENYKTYVTCECTCGNKIIINKSNLINGHTQSCGCINKENPPRRMNIIGEKFGELIVIEYNGTLDGVSWWKCLCSCGNVVSVRGTHLKRKKDSISSCGCIEKIKKIEKHILAGIHNKYLQYKQSALKRNLSFELNEEQFKEITSKSCYYCNQIPKNKNKGYYYNGIDRKNNFLGYIIENVVPCCETCNRAKLQMTEQDFLSWIDRVYAHQHKPIDSSDFDI